MIHTITYTDALQMAEKANRDLRAGDPRFNQSVLVISTGGLIMENDAFLFEYGGFLAIFREHGQPLIFDKAEVYKAIEYKIIRVAIDAQP